MVDLIEDLIEDSSRDSSEIKSAKSGLCSPHRHGIDSQPRFKLGWLLVYHYISGVTVNSGWTFACSTCWIYDKVAPVEE